MSDEDDPRDCAPDQRRDQQIQGVLARYPLRVAWSETEEADETIVTSINVEVGDAAVVERLAADLRRCGCVVKVQPKEKE